MVYWYNNPVKKTFLWILPLAWAALIWRLTTSSAIIVTQDSWLQNVLMDVAHFSFFGIQAILFYFLLRQYSIFSVLCSIVPASLYGALIEFRQLTVVGRTADPIDWILDTLGAITFLVIIKKLYNKRYL